MTSLPVWVMSDGRRGIENQALGLAQALAQLRPAEISKQTIRHGRVFKSLPPSLQVLMRPAPKDYGLCAPFPRIAIGCGRQAIAPLRALKKAAGSQIFTVYVQDPREACRHFDLVIAPEHDGLSGPNVISMIGSPNRITDAVLKQAEIRFSKPLSALPKPRAALLVGGPSKSRHMSEACHAAHIEAAKSLRARGYSLMISTSRRTPDWAAHSFADFAKDDNGIWLYDGGGDNPYFAFLAAAQMILVTEESTNMLTEACATGTPVYRLPMDGAAGKFETLYQALNARCGVRQFSDAIEPEAYRPLIETEKVAKTLLMQFDRRA